MKLKYYKLRLYWHKFLCFFGFHEQVIPEGLEDRVSGCIWCDVD